MHLGKKEKKKNSNPFSQSMYERKQASYSSFTLHEMLRTDFA